MNISEIAGHRKQIELLIRAYKTSRLAHAYLFYGPDGVGKRSVALALIKRIFCENPIESGAGEEDPCSLCASCRKFEAGNHPDLIIVQPEKSVIKIETIRELQRKLHYGKYTAKYRFCVIDSAEKMRQEGANALLKTLEEPPPDVAIILITSKINMLLPTIVSRCQKVRFNPLDDDEIKEALIKRYSLKDDEAGVLANFLQGSFARATPENFNEITQLRKDIIKKIRESSLHNLAAIISFSEELSEPDKEQMVETIEIVKTFYRDAALLKSGLQESLLNKDIASEIGGIASKMTQNELFEKIDAMSRIQSLLMANVNKKLAMESMLMGLCS